MLIFFDVFDFFYQHNNNKYNHYELVQNEMLVVNLLIQSLDVKLYVIHPLKHRSSQLNLL